MKNKEAEPSLEDLLERQKEAHNRVINLNATGQAASQEYNKAVRQQEEIDRMVEEAKRNQGQEQLAA